MAEQHQHAKVNSSQAMEIIRDIEAVLTDALSDEEQGKFDSIRKHLLCLVEKVSQLKEHIAESSTGEVSIPL